MLLLVACWFAGECGGGLVGGVFGMAVFAKEDAFWGFMLLFALVGACVGASIARHVAQAVPPNYEPGRDGEDDEPDDPPPPRPRPPQTGEFYDPERGAHRPPRGTEIRATEE